MTMVVKEVILEVFGSFKTIMIVMFDERYATLAEPATAESPQLLLLWDNMGERRCSTISSTT